MKKLLTILLLTSLTVSLMGQAQLGVKSFSKLANDLDARVNEPLKDQNGDLAAIIKVVTTQTGFTFDCGQIGIVKTLQKPSEIWVYVPYGAKRLTISHPQLGILRDYTIPIPIEKASVYELVLISGRVVTTVEETIVSQWLVITPQPADALVYLNDKFVSTGMYQVKLKPGSYSYRVEAVLHHPEAGKIVIQDTKKELNISLKSAYGYISIGSLPEQGARVTIDGKPLAQTTPCKSEALSSGEHTLQVIKEMYQPSMRKVKVADGQTTQADFMLEPTFAEVKVNIPQDATLFINNQQKSTGNWQGRLSSGVYSLEARKDKHRPAKQDIELSAGDKKDIDLQPVPLYGALDVLTKPAGATITIDGKEFGTTPNSITQLLIGDYNIQIQKKGFFAFNKKITIAEGSSTEINETLRSDRSIANKSIPPATRVGSFTKPAVNQTYHPDYYKYRKSKNFWLASALVIGATGALLTVQSGKTYTQYQTATLDAAALFKKVELYDLISPIAFGVAGFCTIEFVIKSSKQNKAKKQPLSLYPLPLKNGGGFGLAYNF